MDTKIKQRLIGAAVLIGMGVVFIPMLFDSNQSREFVQKLAQLTNKPVPPSPMKMALKPMPKIDLSNDNTVDIAIPNTDIHLSGSAEITPPSKKEVRKLEPTHTAAAVPTPAPAPAHASAKSAGKSDQETPLSAITPIGMASAETAGVAQATPLQAEMQEVTDMRSKLVEQQQLLAQEKERLVNQRKVLDTQRERVELTLKHGQNITSKLKGGEITIATASHQAENDNNATSSSHKEKTAKVAEVKTTEKSLKLPKSSSWIVQLGSFGQQQNADRLVKNLKEKGFAAYTRKTTGSSGRVIYKVVVGPSVAKDRAQKLASQLQTKMNLTGLVVMNDAINM